MTPKSRSFRPLTDDFGRFYHVERWEYLAQRLQRPTALEHVDEARFVRSNLARLLRAAEGAFRRARADWMSAPLVAWPGGILLQDEPTALSAPVLRELDFTCAGDLTEDRRNRLGMLERACRFWAARVPTIGAVRRPLQARAEVAQAWALTGLQEQMLWLARAMLCAVRAGATLDQILRNHCMGPGQLTIGSMNAQLFTQQALDSVGSYFPNVVNHDAEATAERGLKSTPPVHEARKLQYLRAYVIAWGQAFAKEPESGREMALLDCGDPDVRALSTAAVKCYGQLSKRKATNLYEAAASFVESRDCRTAKDGTVSSKTVATNVGPVLKSLKAGTLEQRDRQLLQELAASIARPPKYVWTAQELERWRKGEDEDRRIARLAWLAARGTDNEARACAEYLAHVPHLADGVADNVISRVVGAQVRPRRVNQLGDW